MTQSEQLPLFPLQTVLFPEAVLPLRIFESRYIDLIRECTRSESGFGVVCQWPEEAHGRARHARIGTEAIITDFAAGNDGLLSITCQGQRRFRIQKTRARDDGLIIAGVDWMPPEPAVAVPARLAALQTLMQELMQHNEIAELPPIDLDDASRLGRRLAAVLPLGNDHAQALLELSDPIARLEALVSLLRTGD